MAVEKGGNLRSNGSSELDKVTSSDQVTSEERRERVHRVVDTSIGSKVGLDVREQDHRAVSTSTLELARLGEADSIVEGQTEGLVDVLTALAIEQVLLQVLHQWEEHTALSSEVSQRETSRQGQQIRTAWLEVTLPSGQVTRLTFAAAANAARATVATESLKTIVADEETLKSDETRGVRICRAP